MARRVFKMRELVSTAVVKLKLVPTNEMIADFLTKPLEYAAFVRCRDYLMNVVAGRETK